jgi:23S rRNA-/tRNA-specific pseudouridylate synthase
MKKTYQALVLGKTPEEGKVEAGIIRDKENDRMKIQETTYSFTKGTVRESVTHYKTIRLYSYSSNPLSLIEVHPQTGRMHQIRVHMKHAGFPLIGDQLYQTKLSNQLSKELNINRQFLHAVKLEFDGHVFESALTPELKKILELIA